MEKKELLPAVTMSFLQLIEKYKILVPVIQRDYAQGRQTEDVQKIREDFVHDLLCYIKDNSHPHQVDFVYGTVKREEGKFIPLDGQQRLTTLFLLHLYVAGINGKFEIFHNKIKGKFEYETRTSSKDFCSGLISHDVCGELLNKRKDKSGTSLSDVIENQGWFFSAWKQDPTVHGMLVMLDEIDKQVVTGKYDMSSLYKNLFDAQNSPIVFQWQPLDGYTLTDDLYIKMNARGLKLTDFEVFKALYEMSLKNVKADSKKEFEEKIDGEWCDFLWQYKGGLKSTDQIMERIIRLMIAFGFAGQVVVKEDDQPKLDKLFGRNKQKIQFAYSRYREIGVFHDTHQKPEEILPEKIELEKQIAKCIVEAFSIICSGNASPLISESKCLPWCDERALILKVLQNKIEDLTYEDFVYFYAYISFASRYKGDTQKEMRQWMRYIYNLNNATIVDGSMILSRVIRSIDNMLINLGNKDVLSWISENPRITAFSSNQINEEYVKAKLILWGEKNNVPEWKQIIELNEQDKYMRGQIGFLLVISGVYDIDNIDFNINKSQKALEKIADSSEKARNIFSHFDKEREDDLMKSHLLERALLCYGMYLKNASAGRLNFCNHPYDRDNSWRKMLEITPGKDSNEGVKAMEKLLTQQWTNKNDAITSLKSIIDNYNINGKDEWYAPFIGKYGVRLIDICHQGYIQKNNNTITLLHESQMNHYHSELQSRLLHFELKPSYNYIHYCSVRSREVSPGVYFKLLLNNQVVSIYMYYQDSWYLEVLDEPMYNNMVSKPEWNSLRGDLCQILNLTLNSKKNQITRDYITTLLESLSKSNKDIIVN